MTRSPAAWALSMVVGLMLVPAALAPAAQAAKLPKAPGPKAQVNPGVQLQALSCPATGYCSAVGDYADGLGNSQGLLADEVNGTWRQAVRAQPPADAALDAFRSSAGGGLVAVACPAAGDCVAVGRYTDAARTDHGLALRESGGHWHRGVALRLPANAIAVTHRRPGVVDPLGIAAVGCSSVGNCVVVGNYQTTAEVWEPLIITERNGHWLRGIEAPLPAGARVEGQNSALLSITCAPSGQCTAAGAYVDPLGHQQALLVTGAGGRWSAAPAPAAPVDANTDPNMLPASIACAAVGQCATVGTYVNPLQNSLGLLLSESGGHWLPAAGATLPPGAAPAGTVGDQTVVLSSVACPQAGACTAVGWYFDNDGNGQGLLVTQSAGVWQPAAEVTLPINAVGGLEKQSAGLDWISCASLGNCLATGVYTDLGYNSQGLLVPEVGGIWQPAVESPLPRGAANVQYAAANQSDCTAPGYCTVIGQYNDTHGDVLGYMLSERDGSFGRAVSLRLPPATAAEEQLSLRAILAPSGHQAAPAKIRAADGFDYAYQAVAPGVAQTSWYAAQNGVPVLIGHGRARVTTSGSYSLALRLTAAGHRVLSHAGRLRVLALAQFKPRGRGRTVHAAAGFTLG